jgi:flagellar biosynthesis GTPase FlhF
VQPGRIQNDNNNLTTMPSTTLPRATTQDEWLSGPLFILDSDENRTEICHIPPGHRFKEYRIKPGSVVDRASCTVKYAEANSKEAINRLVGSHRGQKIKASIAAEVGQLVELGRIEGSVGRSCSSRQIEKQSSRSTHAAIVLYGSTKKNKRWPSKLRSRIHLQLEIRVEKVVPPPSSPPAEKVVKSPPPDKKVLQPSSHNIRPATEASKFTTRHKKNQSQNSFSEEESDIVVQPVDFKKIEFDTAETREILNQKLQQPSLELKDSDSIAILSLCVEDGVKNTEKVVGKDTVVVLGNTGCGKSTFVNYLLGCDMVKKAPSELGLQGLESLVVVKSVAEGGQRDEVMPIGHAKKSKTFVPTIVEDPACQSVAYCDCPGFLDNRGSEINIANAVNMKGVMKQARSVKVVILINYHSLLADRGRGLTDMLSICLQLFGTKDHVTSYKDSLLLGVTQAPSHIDMPTLRGFLLEDTPDIMKVLTERLFLYDPLNQGGYDFSSRDSCRERILRLVPILQSVSEKMFQTVLTAKDETALMYIVERQARVLRDALRQGDFYSAGFCWKLLQQLRVIDDISVERMLSGIRLRLQHEVSRRIALFRDYCPHYQFNEAEAQLSSLRDLSRHFPEDDLELDLKVLSKHCDLFRQKQAAEKKREQKYLDEQKRLEARTAELLERIDHQKNEMETSLAKLIAEHSEETSKLRAEMVHQSSQQDEQIKKMREENETTRRKQQVVLDLSQALSEEERMKLEEEQKQLMQQHKRRIEEAENERAIFQAEFENMLEQQRKTQLEAQEKMGAYIIALECQRKEAEQTKVIPVVGAATASRANAFGIEEWSSHLRCRVDQDMPLPNHVNEILDEPCPFWPGRTVRETHLLTLIPATVDGKTFTLHTLAKVSGAVKASVEAENIMWERFGSKDSDGPYWLLITRGVIPQSMDLLYRHQEAMLTQHGYDVPRSLETAISIMTHYARKRERLYEYEYTRCQEMVAWEGGYYEGSYYEAGNYQSLVGGFDLRSTLHVNSTNYTADKCTDPRQGIAGCRRLYSKLSSAYRTGSA